MAAYEAILGQRAGRPVFSLFPIAGCLKLTPEMVKACVFPPGSLLIIDEAQLLYSSLNWAELDQDQMRYYAQHRHNGTDIILVTQHPARLAKALREIATRFVWLTSWGLPAWRRVVTVDVATGEQVQRRVYFKRAILMRLESVGSYDAWGQSGGKLSSFDGYECKYHLVKPWVFAWYDSYDMSQLSGREYPKYEWWDFAKPRTLVERIKGRFSR